jgi:hypothetical protein
MIGKWREGYQVVYGVRVLRKENPILTFQRKIFYRLMRFLSPIDLPNDAGDFRLLDREVIESLRQFKETTLYLRGIISCIGFQQLGFNYNRRPRWKGESKFSWWDYVRLSWDGITSFSTKPLTLIAWVGVIISVGSLLSILFYLTLWLQGRIQQPGFMTTTLILLFVAGLQMLSIGILGTYIGRVFEEVKSRPRSIIEKEYPQRD